MNNVIACILRDGMRVLTSSLVIRAQFAVAHFPKSGEALVSLVTPSLMPLLLVAFITNHYNKKLKF